MDVVELRVSSDVRQIRTARQWVRGHALARGVEASVVRVVELLTSELVTNAVKYGRGDDVLVRLGTSPRELRVEVHDASAEEPSVLAPARERAGGRGMHLVSMLAREWGVERHASDGKAVWFAVPLTGSAAAATA